MKKPTFKRLVLGLIQHILAAVAVLLVVLIMVNGRIRVIDNSGNSSIYSIAPFESTESFEESDIFRQMFQNSVKDLIPLAVIKEQLETNGVFDGSKEIDCTKFVNRKAVMSNCPVTAVYQLEDLVSWGRTGVEMVTWSLEKRAFVQYFDDHILDSDNFYLDENNQIRFRGIESDFQSNIQSVQSTESSQGEAFYFEVTSPDFDYLFAYASTDDYLVDIVYEYLVRYMDKELILVEENGTQKVQFQMLKCMYTTIDGDGQLTGIADNWMDYAKLENNVVATIEDITYNFNQYQTRNDVYLDKNSNLKYAFRLGDEDNGKIITNLSSDFNEEKDSAIDNYFAGLGKYMIYSLDSLKYTGNVTFDKDGIWQIIVRRYGYAFPTNTKIWVGVDTSYYVTDQFAAVKNVYERFTSHIGQYMALIILCILAWLFLWNYLFITAGKAVDENGFAIHYLNWFDKIYTEIVLLLGAGMLYAGFVGFAFLMGITDATYIQYGVISETISAQNGIVSAVENNTLQWYAYGFGVLYGFMASLSFCFMWYSLIRRIKGRNLWRNSCLNYLYHKMRNGIFMVLYHKNTAVRTLIPYNLFVFGNLMGFFFLYILRYHVFLAFLDIAAILFVDAAVGVILFRKNAEMSEIIEGINKIRQGEVDYQLEANRLHGENRDMAEAVNNIGEGIRNAVETSMKDERMKTDLITNVSHDIKTPLTSIINYVDLLKREKISQEPARGYIEILESKAQRLKQLTDDLVEVSRISSGNIILVNEKLNLTELINQTLGEFSEKFEQKNLLAIFNDPETPAYIYADSRRMWRVMENLFNNICKYAMPSTRVYVDIVAVNSLIELSIKNISEQQLNISPEELTERFIRGDSSRTTEGSGLGLSITQNLVTVQGGKFRIQLDGDLFKAIIRFPEYHEQKLEKAAELEDMAQEKDEGLPYTSDNE